MKRSPKTSPPQIAEKLLLKFLRHDLAEEVLGDLAEKFYVVAESRSLSRARLNYWYQVLHYLRPFAIRNLRSNSNYTIMFTNHLKIARRKMLVRKASTFSKIFSLSVGIVSLFFIAVYLNHEMSFESFHSKKHNIYRVNTAIHSPTGSLDLALTATPVGGHLKSVAPEVQDFVRVSQEHGSHAVRFGEKLFSESKNIFYADKNFFEVFDFKLLEGNVKDALDGPDKIILTKEMAAKYFGDENALHKVLFYDDAPFTVSGIVEDVPENSHLRFGFLISMETFLKSRPGVDQNWTWFPMFTYLLVKNPENLHVIERELERVPHYAEAAGADEQYKLSVEPLDQMHFSEPKLGETGAKGNLSNMLILSGIGVMIMLLAVTNFVSLVTAEMTVFRREVSIRKTLGASKQLVFSQFLSETALIVSLATIFSFTVILLTFSSFEQFMDTSFDLTFLRNPSAFAYAVLFLLLLVLAGGFFPAIKYANISLSPSAKNASGYSSTFSSRSLFMMFQFSITSSLVICALIVYNQLSFLSNRDLGFELDQKIVVEFGQNEQIGLASELLKAEITAIPGVESVTFSSHVPGQIPNGVSTRITDSAGQLRNGDIDLNLVDPDFIDSYGLRMVAGRNFRNGDADKTSALIVNESVVKAFGFNSPDEIIGASFEQWGGGGKVIGVVSDFNYLSLHNDVGLLSLKVWPEQFQQITVAVSESNVKNTLEALERSWTSRYPNTPFKYYFLDQSFQAQYQKEEQFAWVINLFSFVALTLGLMGLVAFATFWCERRKKEVSIRKVLGAGSARLLWNLYKGFSFPVLIGFIIGMPVSYYFGTQWLNQFAYRYSIGWQSFAIPFVLMLAVVWLAVGAQTVRLVLSNPVDNLKEE